MSKRRGRRTAITYEDACSALAAALTGATRHEIVDVALSGGTGDAPLARLRAAMRAHMFPTRSVPLALRRVVDALDARSRREGLHVIQGWDFQTHRFTDDIAPVLLLDYCARLDRRAADDRAAAAILLDQYFVAVLSMLTVRAWDEGSPNENLDRVSALLRALQGPDGSGHRFVDDAESLLFLAISYYHPDEHCYSLLLQKVTTLDDQHRFRVAAPCAAMLGGHLRWGLRFMYRRDVGLMRDDNVVDYPWLLFAVVTLARAYAEMLDTGAHGDAREAIVEGLLAGLSADPWAFTGKAPACLAGHEAEHAELNEILGRRGKALLDEMERLEPPSGTYSPLAFACNFPLNAAVALVAVAVQDGGTRPTLNALFTHERPSVWPEDSAEGLARRLMEYSSDPARLDARGAPLIVYDPYDGVHSHNMVVRTLREYVGRTGP